MTRARLANAIDSQTVEAIANVFGSTVWSGNKSYSEQIVDILWDRLAALAANPGNTEP